MAVERAPGLLPVVHVLEGAVEEGIGGGIGGVGHVEDWEVEGGKVEKLEVGKIGGVPLSENYPFCVETGVGICVGSLK